jgi:hypothetical protein
MKLVIKTFVRNQDVQANTRFCVALQIILRVLTGFDPEDVGREFLRNVRKLVGTTHIRRQ